MGIGRSALAEDLREQRPLGNFATSGDRAQCRKLHRRYGAAYFFATRWLPARLRGRVHALYAFARVPYDWVGSAREHTPEKAAGLVGYRSEFLRGMDGVTPRHSVLRAFCDVVHEVSMPLDEPLRYLDAMDRDLSVDRYVTYAELQTYMRGSAGALGIMMCHLLDGQLDPQVEPCASVLGEALQLTMILRDLGEDCRRGRIYIPSEDLKRFSGAEDAILREEMSRQFIRLMKFEIERARNLYGEADKCMILLPKRARKALKMARVLYSRVLDRIEARKYDVFRKRVRVNTLDKVRVATRVLLGFS